jgi:hypothetical protein
MKKHDYSIGNKILKPTQYGYKLTNKMCDIMNDMCDDKYEISDIFVEKIMKRFVGKNKSIKELRELLKRNEFKYICEFNIEYSKEHIYQLHRKIVGYKCLLMPTGIQENIIKIVKNMKRDNNINRVPEQYSQMLIILKRIYDLHMDKCNIQAQNGCTSDVDYEMTLYYTAIFDISTKI